MPFAYRNYLLFLLMVVLAFNNVERTAFGIALQGIKVDLDLTDTQLGFLTGIAFALFYAVMGIPIARWADRGNRVTIITVTTALWSVMLALSATALSFVQLLLIRIGLAVGEAGCLPTAHSLVPDYFSRAERPRAISRVMLGASVGLTIGYFAAGWLSELYGWRTTFAILSVPVLILAALTGFTLREPRLKPSPSPSTVPSFKEVCVSLWASATFRHLLIGFSVWAFFGWGLLQWQPAFFIRSHGLETGELGTWLALVYGVGAFGGIYLGGELAARYAARNERLQLSVCAVMLAFFALVMTCAFLAPDHHVALGALAIASFGGNMVHGPLFATIQTLVPPRMRATSIAFIFLFSSLVGMGLGPLATGMLSDALMPAFGEESLRYALVSLCPGYFWAAWHLWRASQTVAGDLKAAHVEESPVGGAVTKPQMAEET